MFRRFVISSCLLLAFVMLQVHNFIPHVHAEKQQARHAHHHYHDDHHHNGQDDKSPHHESSFTDLTHNADFGKVLAKPQFEKQIIEPDFCVGILIELYDKLGSLKNPPQPHPPDNISSLHLIFLSHSLPLRAPPASSCMS